ncbi:MAG: dihydrolipoamide acetyltransferase family protein [Vibrio gallaecicus]
MKSFTLPDLGEGLAESEIVEWHIKAGDVVKVDQIVVTLETAKAIVDVPAPYSGTILKRFGHEGDVINVGSVLLEIEEITTEISNHTHGQLEAESVNEYESSAAQSKDAATVVGKVSHQNHQVDIDSFWVGGASSAQEASSTQGASYAEGAGYTQGNSERSNNQVSALPSARLLAKRLGISIDLVDGSGDSGLILDVDIYNAADKQQPGTEVLKGARRAMVKSMAESHHNVASVTITEEALLNHWNKDEDISIRLIQAVSYASQQEKAMNAWFDATTMTRCVHTTVNIGIAVDSSHGLYVPVLRQADSYNAQDIRTWLDGTVKGIRNRRIGREQLQNATITLSNFGAIAGIYATPVVSPPQVAIVGAGRIIKKVIMEDGKPTEVKAMPLSVTFDHRACTGGEAARFVKALVKHLEREHGNA